MASRKRPSTGCLPRVALRWPFWQATGAQPSGKGRGRSRGPPGCEATWRGKASSRSPSRCAVPTPSARRRGEPRRNRRQLAERRRSDSRPQVSAVLRGGHSPAPPRRRRGQAGHTSAFSGPGELLARAWSDPLEAGHGRRGGAGSSEHMAGHPARTNTRPGVQPGKRVWCAPAASRLFVPRVHLPSHTGMNR